MITSTEIVAALQLADDGGDMLFRHAVVDSRKAAEGDLFVALPGEHVDGHDYVGDAASRGATGAIVARPVDAPIRQFVVDDPLAALQKVARARRAALGGLEVVGITGSVGKTTTKELTAAVLASKFTTLKSEGNLNSGIGMPLVLLELDASHERAVLEMGMWAGGEIALLADMAQPKTGIVTNVGPSHLERMGTIEAITNAKAELVESLPADGIAILNADDPRVAGMTSRTKANVITYGITREAHVRAEEIESAGLNGVRFTLVHGDARAAVYSRLPGVAMVHNALAAAAAGITDGISIDDVAAALSSAQIPTRLIMHRGPNGSTVIDDTYNASPSSMKAALELLGEVKGGRIAVLGDMRELGSAEVDGHVEVGRVAAEQADRIYAVGELGRLIGEAAREAGHADVTFVEDKDAIAGMLGGSLQAGDVVLVKGSRALALETVVEQLEAMA